MYFSNNKQCLTPAHGWGWWRECGPGSPGTFQSPGEIELTQEGFEQSLQTEGSHPQWLQWLWTLRIAQTSPAPISAPSKGKIHHGVKLREISGCCNWSRGSQPHPWNHFGVLSTDALSLEGVFLSHPSGFWLGSQAGPIIANFLILNRFPKCRSGQRGKHFFCWWTENVSEAEVCPFPHFIWIWSCKVSDFGCLALSLFPSGYNVPFPSSSLLTHPLIKKQQQNKSQIFDFFLIIAFEGLQEWRRGWAQR